MPESQAASRFFLLNDLPVLGTDGDDILGTHEAAASLAGLIGASRESTPFTLAIDAAWGMGKSSLMLQIQAELSKRKDMQSVGCVGIGTVENGRVLRRNAAQPGQAVCITLASAPDGGSRLIGARWAQELVEHYQINSGIIRNFPELAGVLDPRARSLARALDLPPAVFLFNAGHDWEIVFTCEQGQLGRGA